MRYLFVSAFLVVLSNGCTIQTSAVVSTTPPSEIDKVGIISTEIFGLTVGMSPRRVLAEYHENEWRLTSLSPITLEDMVEGGIKNAEFYISTNRDSAPNFEIHFRNNRIIFLRRTSSINEDELGLELDKARAHLNSLGSVDEKLEDLSKKLIYRPYSSGYVYYDFHKLVQNQEGYRVWFAVADYGP